MDYGLDLCCGPGGASKGYFDAGYNMIGVDIELQPSYPFAFEQADSIKVLDRLLQGGRVSGLSLDDFAFIHASPPCQSYSKALRHLAGDHPKLIDPLRILLRATGLPYVIENTPGAPLVNPVTLCGSMFRLASDGYQLVRHREFESSFSVMQLIDGCKLDARPVVGIYGGKVRNRRHIPAGSQRSRVGTTLPLELGQRAMGIDWMNARELSQAIPPAYTAHIGHALRRAFRGVA